MASEEELNLALQSCELERGVDNAMRSIFGGRRFAVTISILVVYINGLIFGSKDRDRLEGPPWRAVAPSPSVTMSLPAGCQIDSKGSSSVGSKDS